MDDGLDGVLATELVVERLGRSSLCRRLVRHHCRTGRERENEGETSHRHTVSFVSVTSAHGLFAPSVPEPAL